MKKAKLGSVESRIRFIMGSVDFANEGLKRTLISHPRSVVKVACVQLDDILKGLREIADELAAKEK